MTEKLIRILATSSTKIVRSAFMPLRTVTRDPRLLLVLTSMAIAISCAKPWTESDPGALARAIERNDTKAVGSLLDELRTPEGKRAFTCLALVKAAAVGKPDVVTMVLERGTDVNCRDSEESGTALIEAALAGKGPLVALLLQKGANPNVSLKVNKSQSSLPLVALLCTEERAEAVYTTILRTLIEHGADVNATGTADGSTTNYVAIFLAAGAGNLEKVKLLVGSGARFRGDRFDASQTTPLIAATMNCHLDVRRFLEQAESRAGAIVLSNYFVRDHKCGTPR